jgi:phosphate transport system permease protein
MSDARRDAFGLAMTWLTFGALALSLMLIFGLITLVAFHGFAHFWQRDVESFELLSGERILGEVREQEAAAANHPARLRLKTGNREVTGLDFRWINEPEIAQRELSEDVLLLERLEWGNFYGKIVELRRGNETLARAGEVWDRFGELHERKLEERAEIRALETGELADVNWAMEQNRLALRRLELSLGESAATSPEGAELRRELEGLRSRYERLVEDLTRRGKAERAEVLVMETAQGRRVEVPLGDVVRAVRPNALGRGERVQLYLSRLWEFLSADPRESNTEGGIFPAIFGTVMMVFLTSIAVAPFGVLAAVYLREYAREGVLVRVVRIAVNSLAGVPSIVFGVFGLGFFVYLVGGTIDRVFFPEALPSPTFGTGGILWASLTLALLTVPVVIVSTEEGLAAVPRMVREASLALGATKFETLRRVVMPASMPGVMTGLILAMARAAGEVAPLMIVGMVKLAPSLPIDHYSPFVHLERKFMHLGFHIYDVGFQSPNVEAVRPLVFATALLLILVVLCTNLSAILIRNHLRRKYASSAV